MSVNAYRLFILKVLFKFCAVCLEISIFFLSNGKT